MTESHWLACENPNCAIALIRACGKPSRRKDRLAAVAGLRHAWDGLSAAQRRAVEAAEQYAGGEIDHRSLRAATVRATGGEIGTHAHAVALVTHRVAGNALWAAVRSFLPVVWGGTVYTNPPFPDGRSYAEQGRPMMTILRDIFGNPFRPIAVDPRCLTSTVASLADAIYTDRAFDRLPILADALEDAGGEDADILTHCRGPGPHVRGCWVVDAVLGKT